ncbi:MAG: hypothetical protein CL927_08475 [Deltaproteobacteria bacterium]|nr:hypothetical protein [Deltaproteobacteria bacterium]
MRVSDSRDASASIDRWSGVVLATVFLAVLWSGSAWMLGSGTPWGNDNSAHYALAVHLSEVMEAGETDLWWHPSNQGIPLFAAYHPLPGLVSGGLIALLGGWLKPIVLFKSTILIPWALMPLAWTIGARWMGLSRPAALLLGAMTLTIHDPDAIGFGVRSATIRGLYTQHFGLLFLPLAIGACWRRTNGSAEVWTPAILFALLTMSHLWVGLYGAIALAAMLLAEPRMILSRILRLLPVVGVAGVVLAPWLGPLLATNHLAGGLPWLHELQNGWPWRDTLARLAGGAVFDTGRLPILTVLAGVGSLGLARRVRDPDVRRWLVLSLITGALFLGRTNLGAFYDRLPLHGQLNVMRYITGLHICGLLAATASLSTVVVWTRENLGARWSRGMLGALVAGMVALGLSELRPTLRQFDPERSGFAELVDTLASGPDTRFVVHERLGTTSHFHRDLLPLLTDRGQLQSYAHGFHCTPSTYYAEYFDFSPAAAGLFGAGTVVAKQPLPEDFPREAWSVRWENHSYVVLQAAPDVKAGLFSFVQIQGRLVGPSVRAFRPAVRALAVPAYARGVLPELWVEPDVASVQVVGPGREVADWSSALRRDLLDQLAPTPVISTAKVLSQERTRSSYSADVRVEGDSTADLLLKVNYFPWWRATVDGEDIPIRHVAPNFMAIAVSPGLHRVRFVFENPPMQKLGALLSGLLLLVWPVALIARRRRSKRRDGRDTER